MKERPKRIEWFNIRSIGIVLGLLALLTLIGGSFAQHGSFNLHQFFSDLWSNLGTELASIVITVFVIDALNQRRAVKQQKDALILQMGSFDNAFSAEAVRALRQKGWLGDGSLHGAWLVKANLQEVWLWGAELEGAKLWEANLQGADLERVGLKGAVLHDANLRGANLERARLEGARLTGANLEGSVLVLTQLQGAHLERARLQGALLRGTWLQGAILLEARLQGAKLWTANLNGAGLSMARLQGAEFYSANLEGADLREANLEGANLNRAELSRANLLDARRVTIDQLAQAKTLEGIQLPDGTKLPDDDSWLAAFEAWSKTVETDEEGYIIPFKVLKEGDELES